MHLLLFVYTGSRTKKYTPTTEGVNSNAAMLTLC
jgi:hypothetical protein